MPSPTTPAIPARADSSTLAKHFLPGEPAVIVKLVGVGNTAPFEFRDSKGARTFVMRWDAKAGGHQIRVPLSVWQANNAKIAHDFMDQRRMSHAVVVTVDVPATLEDAAKQSPGAAWIQALGLLSTLAPEMQINVNDPLGMARTIYDTVSKSQVGEVVNSPDSYSGIAGANPAPATTFPTEKGATDTASDALNVVGPGLAEPTVAPASETFTPTAEGTVYEIKVDTPDTTLEDDKPLVSDEIAGQAYDLVEQPKRIKALAALMGVDEAILREAITSPASKVELVNPGWVRRKEA